MARLRRAVVAGSSRRCVLHWIDEMLSAKGLTHFGQLKDSTTEDEQRRYSLQVIASDISDRSMLVLPRDAARLGIDPDQLRVADAVRMSMSIPIFFEPVIRKNPETGDKHMIVDGGLLSNFPVWLFDVTDRKPEFPTFGLQLVAPIKREPAQTAQQATLPSFVDYLMALADTATEAHDRFYLKDEDFARTIQIPTLGIRTTDFHISPDNVRALIESGHPAAKKFLSTWDFGQYVATYRSGTPATVSSDQPIAAPAH